jgi:hypothetical protein
MAEQAEHCVFCGALLAARQARRHKKPAQLRAQCDTVWRETPIVWRELSALASGAPANSSLAFCMPCVHWISRATRRAPRALAMLDGFLLFTLFPFTARLPDARLLRRLAATLAGKQSNLYRRLFPVHALAALQPFARAFDYRAAVHALCCAHWAHHGGDFLLGESGEAKRMRRLGLALLQPAFERAMAA